MRRIITLRSLVTVFLILLLVVPVLSGCKAQVQEETITYRVGFLEFPRTKNPFAALGAKTDFNALTQVYEPLLAHTDNYNTALPILAKSWEWDSATKSWTFHLDEKAKFSDGTFVTANDVKYSWETSLNVANQFPTAKSMLDSVIVVDEKTVKLKLTQTYVDFLNQVGNVLIVPEHVWSTVGDVLTYKNDSPIGSGPYFWTEFVTDSHVAFTKNPNYWRGASNIDEIVFKFYGAAESMLMAYQKGDIEAMSSMDIKSAVPALLMDTNIKTFFSTGNITNVMMMNHRKEPFNILAFREAINIVIDRPSIIGTVLNGYGVIPQQVPIAPCSNDSNPKVKWPYETKTQTERIAMANAKLDSIPNMSGKGSDGVRSYKGIKLAFDFYYSTAPETVRMSELIIGNVKEIGVQFNAKPMSFTTAYAKVFRHEGKAPLGWDLFFSPSSTFYESWLDPAPKPLAEGGYWRPKLFMGEASGYTNTTIEGKIAQRQVEMDDAKRLALDMEIQELFAADVPLICLHHSILIHTFRIDRFTNWIAGTGPYTGGGISYGLSSISFGICTFNTLNLKPVKQ